MAKRIVVNVIPEEIRMALTEDASLLEVAVERTDSSYMVGNIYKGRVENVLPGMQAAFINIGIGKNAFLYAGDIFPHKSFQRLVEEDNLTVGAEIMIEIVKDAMGTKGPRATTHFSIPGRYVVVMPSVDYVGVSRRIESGEERARLRSLAEKIRPKGMGVIVRTVAEGHNEEELARDFQYLSNLWNALTAKAKKAKAPVLLYRDADLVVRIIRDHVKDDIDEVVIDNAEAHARMLELAKFTSPDLVKKIHLHKGKTDIFTHYGLEEEWGRLADRRVDLKCGGYLIIDKTEALTVIDVNTGRFIGHSNLADTVFRANMEAAAEIARQLRLRDVGGIIVADFIDMQKEGHKKAIIAELEARLKADNTKTNVLGLTELGLVEMTRKKARQTYEGTLYESCPCCGGRGIVQSPETVSIAIHRQLRRLAAKKPGAALVVQMHPRILERFGDKKAAATLAEELGIELSLEAVESLQPEVYAIFEGGKALVRSEELKKVRKPSPRRSHEDEIYDGQALAEPLSAEEMVPLLAEKFALEAVPDAKPTLEMRLAAMTDSLWEPLLEPDDTEETIEKHSVEEAQEKEAEDAGSKKPRRRRRSKKTAKSTEVESVKGQDEYPEASPEEVVETELYPVMEDPKKKKTRRRRKKKKAAEEITENESVPFHEALPEKKNEPEDLEDTGLDADEPDEGNAVLSETKKKRRRRRKKKTVAAEAPSEPESAEPEPMHQEMTGDEEPAVVAAKPKRRRKKKKPAVDAEAEAELLPVAATENVEQEEAAPVKKKRRRRKKKTASPDSADATEVAETEEDRTAEENLAETVGDTPPAKKKRRRRRSPAKKQKADASAEDAASTGESD